MPVLLSVALLWVPSALAEGDLGGVELIPETRKTLWTLQQAWGEWNQAFRASDREAAQTALDQINSLSRTLGMQRLPDLANAAVALGVEAAQGGDFERARWALEAARSFDEARPESEFAESTILRLQGDYIGGVSSALRGHVLALGMPLERTLWLNNLQLWALYTLLFTGGLFVALLMALKGSAVFYDLARLFSGVLSRGQADIVAVLILLWPVVLPRGVLWLILYWSILLFTYGSRSEKSVLVALWLALGLSPLLLSYQQREAQLALLPPTRLVDNMASSRLYGSIFSDLEVLRSLAPDSPAVTELAGDLHRKLGQWDHARAIYTELAYDPEQASSNSATAFTNIGVYHHRKQEYDTAASYFQRATQADDELAIAFYDLSQAYAQMFEWDPSHAALARARELDPDGADRWKDLGAQSATESAIPVDGSMRRLDEIRGLMVDLWRPVAQSKEPFDLLRRHRAFATGLAALILALILHQARKQVGLKARQVPRVSSGLADNKWAQVLIPGLASGEEESGLLAFLGILIPVSFVMVPLLRGMGYRAPLAYEPGPWLAIGFAIVSLVVLGLVRTGLVMLSD
ncbi:MAG: hypothetical protein MPN21_12765 [Thermoanaerobaculia bacterium]|nr:hypothetical protein [Thermoanaerobaculia bacterium]